MGMTGVIKMAPSTHLSDSRWGTKNLALSHSSLSSSPELKNDSPRFGVSGPLSLLQPTPAEKAETERLVNTLKNYKIFEDEDQVKARQVALSEIEVLLREFVYNTSLKNGLTEAEIQDPVCKVYTFGSFSLGAHFKGSDIDVLCLVSESITKQDFFEGFSTVLKALPKVKSLTAVTHAYVPVLKMEFNGIQIDLVFACLPLPKNENGFDLENYDILAKCEDTVLRSLNGPRVSQEILNLVPKLDTFQMALRFIKLWAKCRGLYSNVMGYFGGVAWAIMVARICQLFPYASVSTIVQQFFEIYQEWQWPHPIILKRVTKRESLVPAWDPSVTQTDQSHRMPVITPAFPSMCSTHNVTKMNQAIITAELIRAAKLTKKILAGNAIWDDLLRDPKFFSMHKQLLQVLVCTDNEADHHGVAGNVESKVRSFAASVEQIDDLAFIHTNPYSFSSVHYCQSEAEVTKVREGDLTIGLEDPAPATCFKTLHVTCFYIGILPGTPTDTLFHSPELESSIQELFGRAQKPGEIFPSSASLKVLTIAKSSLPSNVFTTPSHI
ncbi:polynucleotide adenylyltransferase [Entomophthora muscae]|uniref:Polynucleotide adenylyltransferase n=2 Tax=Entomophthora muscae TaxID=34485 RepID=A0ACC2U3T0_9FUNG|nr:polynucleotide adenylyltransferase [Entomophthora muscae]